MRQNYAYTFYLLIIMTASFVSFSSDAISMSASAPTEYHNSVWIGIVFPTDYDSFTCINEDGSPGVRIKFDDDGTLFDCDGQKHILKQTYKATNANYTVYNYGPEKISDIHVILNSNSSDVTNLEPATVVSVDMHDTIDVTFNESKGELVTTKPLSYNSVGGGALIFTPINTPGQFRLQSGSDEMEYTINSDDDSSVTVSPGTEVKNGSYHVTLNPQEKRLHPGKYTGSLTVDLKVN